MLGTILSVKKGFGFITQHETEKVWYFQFSDLVKVQTVYEGQKVKFEKKNNEEKFKTSLYNGDLKDAVEGSHRNPRLAKTGRESGIPKAPAANKVEILAEQGAQ